MTLQQGTTAPDIFFNSPDRIPRHRQSYIALGFESDFNREATSKQVSSRVEFLKSHFRVSGRDIDTESVKRQDSTGIASNYGRQKTHNSISQSVIFP